MEFSCSLFSISNSKTIYLILQSPSFFLDPVLPSFFPISWIVLNKRWLYKDWWQSNTKEKFVPYLKPSQLHRLHKIKLTLLSPSSTAEEWLPKENCKGQELTWSYRCVVVNQCRGVPGDTFGDVPLDKRVACSLRSDGRALPRSMVLSPLCVLVNDSESSPHPPHNASVILQQGHAVILRVHTHWYTRSILSLYVPFSASNFSQTRFSSCICEN